MGDRGFPERLAEAMRAKHVSQRALARAVGVTPAAVRKWLRGTIPRETFLALCALQLNVDTQWLAEGTAGRHALGVSPRHKGLLAAALLVWQRKQIDKATTDLREKIEEHLKLNKQLRDQGFEPLPDFARPTIEIGATVDDVTETRYESEMPPKPEGEMMDQLIEDVKRLTTARGSRAKLARALNVRPQRLNEWLNQGRVPRGGISLLLRDWVRAEEAQLKRDPRPATTERGQVTQSNQGITHEKTGSKKPCNKVAKRSIAKRGRR